MFYNELDVLELRLTLLDEWVDKFVLVESEINHAGGPKELFFQKNKDRFAKWVHKIDHVVVTATETPTGDDLWVREKHQREQMKRGLDGVPADAIVMISDVDEIPDLDRIPIEKLPHKTLSVHMWMFEYSFEHMFTGEPWFGTVITTSELVCKWGPNYFRSNRWSFPRLEYSGWHLSSFGDAEHVWNKIKTYAHAKDEKHSSATFKDFEDWVKNGVHSDGKVRLIGRHQEVPLPASNEVLRRIGLLPA